MRRSTSKKQDWLDQVALSWDSDDCLLFPFPLCANGYGNFMRGRKTVYAHTYICIKINGERPKKKDAAHSCGIRHCVNGRHLRWASRQENEADKLVHGTHRRGRSSKLTPSMVMAIRLDLAAGEKQKKIATKYGVSSSSINHIHRRTTWSWL